jgi:hypothetical protein
MNKSYDVIHAFDLIPIYWRIANQYPQAPFLWQLLIQRAHEREKLLDKCRRAGSGLARLSPNLLEIREGHILSRYISIDYWLVERIAELNLNVVHLFRKVRGADQIKDEIVQILHSMALRQSDDFVFVEGGENGRYGRFWNWL